VRRPWDAPFPVGDAAIAEWSPELAHFHETRTPARRQFLRREKRARPGERCSHPQAGWGVPNVGRSRCCRSCPYARRTPGRISLPPADGTVKNTQGCRVRRARQHGVHVQHIEPLHRMRTVTSRIVVGGAGLAVSPPNAISHGQSQIGAPGLEPHHAEWLRPSLRGRRAEQGHVAALTNGNCATRAAARAASCRRREQGSIQPFLAAPAAPGPCDQGTIGPMPTFGTRTLSTQAEGRAAERPPISRLSARPARKPARDEIPPARPRRAKRLRNVGRQAGRMRMRMRPSPRVSGTSLPWNGPLIVWW